METSISVTLRDQLKEIIFLGFKNSLIIKLTNAIKFQCDSNREIVELEHIKDNKIFSSVFLTREDIEDDIEYSSSNDFTSTTEMNLDKLIHAILLSLEIPGRHDYQSIKKISFNTVNHV